MSRSVLDTRWHSFPRAILAAQESRGNQRRLRAKDGESITSSLSGERTVTQTIYNHRAQNARRLDNFPGITANFLTLNGNTDTTAFEKI